MPHPTPTDEQLIQKIKQGDKIAFRLLFDRHYKVMLATAINMLKDVNTAKDATQDVFLQLWKKRESLNIQSAPGAYLKRSVINRALNQIKSRKAFVEEEQIADHQDNEADAIQQLEAQDLEAAMHKALDSLPTGCRTIFVMRRLEGMRVKEIAKKLDVSPKTVENQLTKALKVLKVAVQPFMDKKDT
jgi:RNA polymerase sigma-70 factor (ECF subfamily)